jgi:ABC-type antimicrobial peptide transport system permease subunit
MFYYYRNEYTKNKDHKKTFEINQALQIYIINKSNINDKKVKALLDEILSTLKRDEVILKQMENKGSLTNEYNYTLKAVDENKSARSIWMLISGISVIVAFIMVYNLSQVSV